MEVAEGEDGVIVELLGERAGRGCRARLEAMLAYREGVWDDVSRGMYTV